MLNAYLCEWNTNYMKLKKMKNLFLMLLVMLIAGVASQAQTMELAVKIKNQNLTLDGKSIENKSLEGKMLVPFTKNKVVLYKNSNFTYYAEFKTKQCGKKTRVISKTYVEKSDGSKIKGSNQKLKNKTERDEYNWFVGFYEDDFGDDLAFTSDFEYQIRFTN